ncbi:MAG: hypothetical protein HYZ28_22085 [Myxococcales bacterium]|nr:hypothetical protein [Myxococcales bacterium]
MLRTITAAAVVLVALAAPACSCGARMSPEDAAKACVVLQACFPNEWRSGMFGRNLSRCATGGDLLPPSPGALTGDQPIVTGLERPLFDIYRCVLGAGGDCNKAALCFGRAGTSGSCSPPKSLESGTCNGQVLSGCSADGFAFSVDCASYGGTCHEDSIFFARVSVCDVGDCPSAMRCRGSWAETCVGPGMWLADCGAIGLSCAVPPDGGGAICDTAASCDGGQPTCEGTVAVGCSGGKPTRQDCARGPTMRRCEAGSCTETGNECAVGIDPATCEGSKVKLCQDGFHRTVDCTALGFAGCQDGRCTTSQTCDGGATPGCGCAPTTCAAEGKSCGIIPDGCGGWLSCGSCSWPQSCGGGGSPGVCGCAPRTCASAGKNCGALSDGCGATLDCGTCTPPQTCGGGGPNVCGSGSCVPTTCAATGKNCGQISDGCGATLSCGQCTWPASCGGGGTANVCGCSRLTCASQGYNCGTAPDGCGGVLSCGVCNGGRTCGAGGQNLCGRGPCAPTSCAASGKNCGLISDGCSATLDCGSCPSPKVCVANVCQ